MRPRPLPILLLLLAGAVVNVTVAWALAWYVDTSGNPHAAGYSVVYSNRKLPRERSGTTHWLVRRVERSGVLITVVTAVRNPSPADEPFESLLPPVVGLSQDLKKLESGAPTSSRESSNKEYLVEVVEIRDIVVHVRLLPLIGESITVDVEIPEIRLENVGTAAGQAIELPDLVDLVLKAVLQSTVTVGGDLIPGDISGELINGLGQLQSLGELGVDVLTEFGDVADIAGDVAQEAEQAREAAEDVGDKLNDAAEELKNLFPGRKDGGG